MREKILIMGGQPELTAALRRALLPLRVQVRPIPPEQYGHSLGYLAGDKSCPRAPEEQPGQPLGQPLLVLAGFGEDRLERALWYLNRERVTVDYKAMLTPTNRQWDVPTLYAEIAKEHAQMHREEPQEP
jgi:hypothetical protein